MKKKRNPTRHDPEDPRVLAALRATVPLALLTRVGEAFDKPLWPGPWDAGEVHDHAPPFCFTRDPRRDCTLRCVEMFRSGMSFSRVAFISGFSRTRCREALLRAGVPIGALSANRLVLTDEQIAVIRELWLTGWSGKEIATIIRMESGVLVSTAQIYSNTPSKFSEGSITYKVVLGLDMAQDLIDFSRSLHMRPASLVRQIIAKALHEWKAQVQQMKPADEHKADLRKRKAKVS